jgi:pyruvate dehydrogenase E2 component (dihydrolipoamide acetyltransferase)
MSISILLPALSPSMESGNIVRWLKTEGDEVRVGDVLAEIETDKATMEIEAFDEGILARIVHPGGSQDVAVNAVIGVLTTGKESAFETREPAEPLGRANALEEIITPPADSAPPMKERPHVFASPLARRLAEVDGIDLRGLSGSGPRGRIVRRDVEAIALAAPVEPETAISIRQRPTGPARETANSIRLQFAPESCEEIELDGMRRTIAARLVEAKTTIPHFYLSVDCEADRLMTLRAELNAMPARAGSQALKLTLNDFVIKALALALQAVPDANVVWAEDRLLKFRHCDIAVAVSVQGGLYTPVIRKAELKSLSSISGEVKELAARARAGQLRLEEYSGGSASISNLGMYGVSNFQPIINPPHAFILGVGAVEERLISRNGQPTSVRAFTVTMSCDHRAVDGALGAQLLREFKAVVEEPMRILV